MPCVHGCGCPAQAGGARRLVGSIQAAVPTQSWGVRLGGAQPAAQHPSQPGRSAHTRPRSPRCSARAEEPHPKGPAPPLLPQLCSPSPTQPEHPHPAGGLPALRTHALPTCLPGSSDTHPPEQHAPLRRAAVLLTCCRSCQRVVACCVAPQQILGLLICGKVERVAGAAGRAEGGEVSGRGEVKPAQASRQGTGRPP